MANDLMALAPQQEFNLLQILYLMKNTISQNRLLEMEKRKKIKNVTTSDHIHLLWETFLLTFLVLTDHYGHFRENKSLVSVLRP